MERDIHESVFLKCLENVKHGGFYTGVAALSDAILKFCGEQPHQGIQMAVGHDFLGDINQT
ncbi:MAG: hypothetical protein LBU32_02945 [Clostridiales bacterium]|nr:hypothetical protein [Clostridiales bacterium]